MLSKFFNLIFNKPLPQGTYDELWLKKFNIRTFIDIGAYLGEYVDYAHQMFPKAKIIAYEPLIDCYQVLRKKTKKIPNLDVYNVAVGSKNGKMNIYRSSYAPSSSLLKMGELHKSVFPSTADLIKQAVTVRTLDSMLQDIKLDTDIFIKIDTQGFEHHVIAGGEKTIRQSTILQIEVSFEGLYQGQVLFHDIYLKLYKLGFILRGFHNQVRSPIDGAILQAHAYFLKHSL